MFFKSFDGCIHTNENSGSKAVARFKGTDGESYTHTTRTLGQLLEDLPGYYNDNDRQLLTKAFDALSDFEQTVPVPLKKPDAKPRQRKEEQREMPFLIEFFGWVEKDDGYEGESLRAHFTVSTTHTQKKTSDRGAHVTYREGSAVNLPTMTPVRVFDCFKEAGSQRYFSLRELSHTPPETLDPNSQKLLKAALDTYPSPSI